MVILLMNLMHLVVLILKVYFLLLFLFIDVSAVVNYSMPSSVSNYIHRIGRTARAQDLGTALSFIDLQNKQEIQTLQDIQKYNPPRNGKPSPQCLPFDIKQIESFSYRYD